MAPPPPPSSTRPHGTSATTSRPSTACRSLRAARVPRLEPRRELPPSGPEPTRLLRRAAARDLVAATPAAAGGTHRGAVPRRPRRCAGCMSGCMSGQFNKQVAIKTTGTADGHSWAPAGQERHGRIEACPKQASVTNVRRFTSAALWLQAIWLHAQWPYRCLWHVNNDYVE